MIRNIIFDFGDIFINLDKGVVTRELDNVSDTRQLRELYSLNQAFEIGDISANEFLLGLQRVLPHTRSHDLRFLWNSMLLDFPEHRLNFLVKLAESDKYRLFLLSNTNEIHIAEVVHKMGASRYDQFKNCFEGFYLSHEIGMYKPTKEIFEYVLQKHGLEAEKTLFVDDTYENIAVAGSLGLHTWHLLVGREDITQLNSRL